MDLEKSKVLVDSDVQWFLNYLNTIFKYYKECYTAYEFEKVKYAGVVLYFLISMVELLSNVVD